MDLNKQKTIQEQTAGDNSVLNQVENTTGNVIIHNYSYPSNPMDATQVVTIASSVYEGMFNIQRQSFTDIAIGQAESRINEFKSYLIPQLEKIQGIVEHLVDPKFNFLIGDAQKSIAQDGSKENLKRLSDLLILHIEKGQDKIIDSGIHKALQIIPELDTKSLRGLTVLTALNDVTPNSGNISEGLDVLNDLYGHLISEELPQGYSWLDHLDILGAIRVSSLDIRDFKEYICEKLKNYSQIGIKIDSDNHKRALEIMHANNIPDNVLIPNECLSGYVRLKISSIRSVQTQYQGICSDILNLYEINKTLQSNANSKLVELWDSRDNLKKIHEWWGQIPKGM